MPTLLVSCADNSEPALSGPAAAAAAAAAVAVAVAGCRVILHALGMGRGSAAETYADGPANLIGSALRSR